MSEPTIDKRLKKRIIVMSVDESMCGQIAKICSEHRWQMVATPDLSEIGDWNDILLYRFLLLDLNEVAAFDPLDVIEVIRMEFQINIPVLCFGGDQIVQEEMRLARADRFFTEEELINKLPLFFEQYQW